MNKEQKAKEYSEENSWYPGETSYESDNVAMRESFAEAYKAGWDEALRSQWIKVETRMPKVEEYVLVMIEYEGSIQIHLTMYLGETNWLFADVKIIAWMPIPLFDKILEDNKDVLKRLKDKWYGIQITNLHYQKAVGKIACDGYKAGNGRHGISLH